MAESQATHRQDLERTVVRGDSKRSFQGMYLGFTLAAMAIAGGIYLLAIGRDIAGYASVFVPLGTLATVFVYATRQRRAERESKTRLMLGLDD